MKLSSLCKRRVLNLDICICFTPKKRKLHPEIPSTSDACCTYVNINVYVSIEKTECTQSRLLQLDQNDVDLDALKHNSRRREADDFLFGSLFQFRCILGCCRIGIFLGCEIFKDFFWVSLI